MKTTVFAPKPVVNLVDGPKVGDVLVGTWGYEACIATFVQVVKVMGKSVSVVELDENRVVHPDNFMYWTSTPVLILTNPLRDRADAKTKRITPTNDGSYCIKWNNFTHLYPWSGEPIECYDVH